MHRKNGTALHCRATTAAVVERGIIALGIQLVVACLQVLLRDQSRITGALLAIGNSFGGCGSPVSENSVEIGIRMVRVGCAFRVEDAVPLFRVGGYGWVGAGQSI